MPWGGPQQLLLTPNPLFPPEPGSPGSASDGPEQEEAEESREGSRSPVATPDRSTRECPARPPNEGPRALPPIPGLCRAAACTDRSHPVALPRKPVVESACKGRTASCQRSSSRQKFYRCVVCGKNFLLKINLIIHQRSHSNWVPYVCVDCNQAFMSKKKIRRHLRIRGMHADLHHFTLCACCNRSFVWASELFPQAERPYWCGECQKAFKQHEHLSGHQKTHSRRESPYECRNKLPLPVAPI
uniref:C2H2-type domain-containing protein n=1 Tax=Anas zonorhyncha TaxID=75864 RepID=A0A8B9UJV3_9AVES